MRLVIISDTHTHTNIDLPEGDVLIHCGDLLAGGGFEELANQIDWLSYLSRKYENFLFVPGNHDICFETNLRQCKDSLKEIGVMVLMDHYKIINDIKFYGSSWQPEFFNWAFNLPRGEYLKEKWNLIPDDTDVLITHGPPYGILDETDGGELVGCEDLRNRVLELEPRIHCFGHIHHSHGEYRSPNSTHFINAAICTERYLPYNAPFVVDI